MVTGTRPKGHEHAPAAPHEDAPHKAAPLRRTRTRRLHRTRTRRGRPAAPHEDAAAAPAPPHEDAPAAPAPPHEDAAAPAAHAPEGFHAADSTPPPSGSGHGWAGERCLRGVAEAKPAVTPTIEAMPAVEEAAAPAPAPAAAPPPEQPAEAAPVAAAAPPIELALGDVPYPGDNAPKPQIAAWMASRAQAAGLPPELPVMAGLVESRLSNVNYGDADSIGYFQMRTSIWNTGEYAGYGQDPEKQIKWFIDHAVHEKEKRVADGYTNFLDRLEQVGRLGGGRGAARGAVPGPLPGAPRGGAGPLEGGGCGAGAGGRAGRRGGRRPRRPRRP